MRILLAETDERTTLQMHSALAALEYVVDIFNEPSLAQEAMKSQKFDLIIIDSNFMNPSSIEIMQEYIADGGSASIIFTVPKANFDDGILALELGADDFVTKPLIIQEFTARVRALMRRNMEYKETVIKIGPLKFDLFSRTAWLEDTVLNLTRREKGVLEVLMKRSGQLVSKELITSYLYTIDDDISQKAIETYIYRLRLKIKHPSIVIKTVWGSGYMLEHFQSNDENVQHFLSNTIN